uniref:G_PROTEIN_RECEP_F1_2 domain-containing protein n=1 Tax=Macrostomum lignano TaxID=282301 RepID=A0A1I8IXA8_9PLAT
MRRSLTTLQRALAGEVGMSAELDDVAKCLFNGQLPEIWRKLAPATLKSLANWMNHFEKRYQQYSQWVNEEEPRVMWLSGLHIPESYLTALVQATCRKNGWPLDKSTLYTTVTSGLGDEDVNEKAHQGCFVSGLYLEGADWDIENGHLIKQRPKQLITQLPVLKVIPIEAHRLKLQNTFRTPVYVTSQRRNAMGVGLVFEADLATSEHSSHWVLQGLANIFDNMSGHQLVVLSTTTMLAVTNDNFTNPEETEIVEIRVIDALIGCFLCLFVTVTVFGNSLVILAVIREHYLRTITNYFIVSLALADLLMGLVVMPFSVISYVTREHWLFGPIWCDLWHAFDVLSTTASILNLCMIAVERYWAIENPISYPSRVTKRRCLLLVSAVWICSCCISFPAIAWWRATSPPSPRHVCSFTGDPVYLICSSLVSFYAPLLVMVFVYCKIYRTATQLVRSWQAGAKVLHCHGMPTSAGNGRSPGSGGSGGGGTVVLRIHRGLGGIARRFRSLGVRKKLARFSREQRAAKTLGIVMGIFIACWLPFFICNIVLAINSEALGDHAAKVMTIVTWLGYINSSINPGIYAHSMRDFRRAFIKLLNCPRCRRRCRRCYRSCRRGVGGDSDGGAANTAVMTAGSQWHHNGRPNLDRQRLERRQKQLRLLPLRPRHRGGMSGGITIASPNADHFGVEAGELLRSPLRARCSQAAGRLSSYQQLPASASSQQQSPLEPQPPPSPIYVCNFAFSEQQSEQGNSERGRGVAPIKTFFFLFCWALREKSEQKRFATSEIPRSAIQH